MRARSAQTYDHTQAGPWGLMLLAIGLIMLTAAWGARHEAGASIILLFTGFLMLFLAASFHDLNVTDAGDHLAVRFGPIPLFQKKIRYDDVTAVEVGRTLLLDGWGIHMSVRGGWVWNVWGRDCVVIHRRRGVVRVGSDDAENLAAFLKGKIAAVESSASSPN
ncbi:MAG: hypothetical protein AB7I30_05110 [Isosphaeraceae bacterium]